ncbi:hypothetical protein IWZ01DRAFT_547568 [Phyllosticta capitalensis]
MNHTIMLLALLTALVAVAATAKATSTAKTSPSPSPKPESHPANSSNSQTPRKSNNVADSASRDAKTDSTSVPAKEKQPRMWIQGSRDGDKTVSRRSSSSSSSVQQDSSTSASPPTLYSDQLKALKPSPLPPHLTFTSSLSNTMMHLMALFMLFTRLATALDQASLTNLSTHIFEVRHDVAFICKTTCSVASGAVEDGGEGYISASTVTKTITVTAPASDTTTPTATDGCPWPVEAWIGADDNGRFLRFPTGFNPDLLSENQERHCRSAFRQALENVCGEEDWCKYEMEQQQMLVEQQKKREEQQKKWEEEEGGYDLKYSEWD